MLFQQSPIKERNKIMNNFNQKLESLRGCAAITVVVAHCAATFRIDNLSAFCELSFFQLPLEAKIVSVVLLFFNPSAAVIFSLS